MFLQILPPDAFATSTKSDFDTQLLFVILGLIVAVFTFIKVAKFLSKIKVSSLVKKLNYTS
jgi:hypothetical protein